mgnify:CR=1
HLTRWTRLHTNTKRTKTHNTQKQIIKMGQFVTMILRCEARVESFPYERWLTCLGQSRERFTASELRKAIEFLDRVAEEESDMNVKIISQVKDELIDGLG